MPALRATGRALLSCGLYLQPGEARLLPRRRVLAPVQGEHKSRWRWAISVAPWSDSRATESNPSGSASLLAVPRRGRDWPARVLQAAVEPCQPAELVAALSLLRVRSYAGNAEARVVNLRCTPHALRQGGPCRYALRARLGLLEIPGRGHWAANGHGAPL